MYRDVNNLIVQKDGDGGDTAQRTGFYYAALYLQAFLGLGRTLIGEYEFSRAVDLLVTTKGLIRNPIKWNDPKDTSRDQTIPMIIACGLYGYEERVKQIKPRFFRYQNGDFESPQNANEVRRALNKYPSLLGDIWALFAAIIRCKQAAKNLDDVGDDLNLLISLVFFNVIKPSIIAKFALRYYLKHRPFNYGMTKFDEHDPVIGALMWYFREESGGNPEIAEAWRPIVGYFRSKLNVRI